MNTKGYARLATIHKELNDFEQSKNNFSIALALDPNNQEYKDILKNAQSLFDDQRYERHESGEEVDSNWAKNYLKKQEKSKLLEDQSANEDAYKTNIAKGDMYQYGTASVEVNYEMAVGHYTKAMRTGNGLAKAVFEMGKLTLSGWGCKKDVDLACEYLREAAGLEPIVFNENGWEVANRGVEQVSLELRHLRVLISYLEV